MLSTPDADVVRRETRLAAMRTILDPERMLELLRRERPDSGLEALRCTYVRYKPGTRVLVGYESRDDRGRVVLMHAWGVPDADAKKLRKGWERALAAAIAGQGGEKPVRVPGLNLLVSFFPYDRRLPALARVLGPGSYHGTSGLRGRDRHSIHPEPVEAACLSYKPERRAVFRVGAEGALDTLGIPPGAWGRGSAALRFYTPHGFRPAYRGIRAFSSGTEVEPSVGGAPSFRLPRLLGRRRSLSILLLNWIEGSRIPVESWGTPGIGIALARDAGRRLAALHGSPAERLVQRGIPSAGTGLWRAGRGTASVLHPGEGRGIRRVVRDLHQALRAPSAGQARAVPIHGDLHPDQLLSCSDGQLGLIDLDRARLGEGIEDLASFVAHLERRALEGQLPPPEVSSLEAAILDGYAEAGGRIDLARYDLHRRAALLRLAPRPFRERSPDWFTVTRALLARAQDGSRRAICDVPHLPCAQGTP